jgi:two-component system, CAI-1 autoinducer sensor kinase/phosphatase CqsS
MLYTLVNTFRTPLEPILHASPKRLKIVGLFMLLGQPFFGWMWQNVFPQPYENMFLRIAAASLGLLLLWGHFSDRPDSKATEWLYVLLVWIELPLLFMHFYFMNSTSMAWVGSILLMIGIYYQLTDWRLATIGLIAAVSIAYVIDTIIFTSNLGVIHLKSIRSVLLLFAWTTAFGLSISSANLRRKRLDNSVTTMGIIAHELRTPLATLSLLGDALRVAASNKTTPIDHNQIDNVVTRIYALSRAMNNQIDMQIANSSLMHLSSAKEEVSAATSVHSAMTQYPFKNQREKGILEVSVLSDFIFLGSHQMFEQTILNLVKNAYHAVAQIQKNLEYSDVRIEVTAIGRHGFVKVFDKGIGVDRATADKIFEPFFSTQATTGHGLGLAFCKAVIDAAGGKISVSSDNKTGTCFTISLPIYQPKRTWTGFRP